LGSEDLLQDAFLDLVRRSEELAPRSLLEWRAWLIRRAFDHLARARSRKRTATKAVEELESTAAAAHRNPIRAQRAPGLTPALEKLTSDERAALDLTIVEGLTVAEAANSLGLSPSTARRRRETALQRLRDLVAARGYR
jgi:RNA polymerase sigma-70 factor (ECF subfamily)